MAIKRLCFPNAAYLNQRLAILLTLYLAQGLPTGIFSQALPAILRSYDVSLTVIGFSGLLAIPWALKFLWSPYVDKYHSSQIWGVRGRGFCRCRLWRYCY
jgi:PAT family beta-lactamase induction signal transducer AmpG